ncbi:MAG: hypothetical protein ACK4Z5_02790 [Brevundimonas sp.]
MALIRGDNMPRQTRPEWREGRPSLLFDVLFWLLMLGSPAVAVVLLIDLVTRQA